MFQTIASSALSMLIGFVFTIYNGILGAAYQSIWNISICIYYFLLTGIRGAIVYSQRKEANRCLAQGGKHRRRIYLATHFVLVLMNVSLIAPVAVMVKGGRSYTFGLIPAIAMAAYTTYRISASVIHFRKSNKSENILVSELRTINLIDSLVAVLTLQNTLIIASGGMDAATQKLSAWTSACVLFIIIIITTCSFLKIGKR